MLTKLSQRSTPYGDFICTDRHVTSPNQGLSSGRWEILGTRLLKNLWAFIKLILIGCKLSESKSLLQHKFILCAYIQWVLVLMVTQWCQDAGLLTLMFPCLCSKKFLSNKNLIISSEKKYNFIQRTVIYSNLEYPSRWSSWKTTQCFYSLSLSFGWPFKTSAYRWVPTEWG